MAIALAQRGMDVAITGRTRAEGDASLPGSLESTAEAVEQAGGRAVPIVLDLLDAEQITTAASEAVAALSRVDILLNNAIYVGANGLARFLEIRGEEIEKRIFGNVTAQMLFTQPLLRHMAERGSGTIAFTTAGAAYATPTTPPGEGGWALSYGVSKAGMHRIAEQLVVEHPDLWFFNLQPGPVATERVLASGAELAFVARSAAPLAVIGETFARILTEPAGTFVNGSTIEVQDLAKQWGLLR